MHSLDALDYVPPVRYPEDLADTDAGQVEGLIETIAGEGGYENVICLWADETLFRNLYAGKGGQRFTGEA